MSTSPGTASSTPLTGRILISPCALCMSKSGAVGHYNGMAYLRREISDKAKCLHIAESQYKSINFVYGDNCSYS